MAATIFTNRLQDTISKRFNRGDVELRDWFRDKALQVSSQNTNINRLTQKQSSQSNIVPEVRIGRLTMYRYDPKHKDTLPYYDRFPMIFPIEQYKDGWLGINMHYLPPVYRARLMDALWDTTNNAMLNETTKLQINYGVLKSAAKFRYFKPCIKRYLTGHIRSPLMEIDVNEWDYALFLPLARFTKARQRDVWNESVNTIMGRK
ncbi:DNA end protector protein [Rhizobium phage RHph_I1_18]|nr:DNA end protector protein [Rhizobium phage RHph_I1_18]